MCNLGIVVIEINAVFSGTAFHVGDSLPSDILFFSACGRQYLISAMKNVQTINKNRPVSYGNSSILKIGEHQTAQYVVTQMTRAT